MNKIRAPFNTNSIAQKAAIEALKDKAHIRQSLKINSSGKKYLYKELLSLRNKICAYRGKFYIYHHG